MSNKVGNRQKRRKKSKFKIFLKVFLSMVLVCALVVGVYINYMLGHMQYEAGNDFTLIPEDKFTPDPGDEYYEDPYSQDPKYYSDAPKFNWDAPQNKDIINILLIGADKRPTQSDNGRSDTMIIATLDKVHKKIKLTSIMRDTYVYIPGDYRDNRINAAYKFGNAPFLIDTINANFNLRLSKYVAVDFEIFQEIVDKIGGVDIHLEDYEVKYLKNRPEAGANRHNLKNGVNKLDGKLALEYTRIRYVGNGDFERTERQRKLLVALFQQGMKSDFITLNKMLTDILPMVRTNLKKSEILSLLTATLDMKQMNVEQLRIPYDKTFTNQNIRGMSVLVPDIQANAAKIREFIYEE